MGVKAVKRLVMSRIRAVFTPSPFHAGFRAKFGCSDHMFRLNAMLHSSHRRQGARHGDHRSVVFIDFQKAFDKVWHRVLLEKMHVAGVSGRSLRWVAAFLADRGMRVVHQSSASDYHPTRAGVPQGAILSPDLFLTFIDDLPSALPRPPPSLALRCAIFLLRTMLP